MVAGLMTLQRDRAIQSVRSSLVRNASPRLHMLVLVTVTGGAGFIGSYLLLHAGIRSMAVRYPLAVGLGYAVFLGLVWVWLRRYRLTTRVRQERDRSHVALDVTELPLDQLFSSAPSVDHLGGFGGGGGFSGGGGGSDWTEGPTSLDAVTTAYRSGGSVSSSGGGGGGWDLDLDESAVWLIPVLIIAAIVLCVVAYLLYLAPTLFAELLLDAGLAAGLYRRLLHAERRSWLMTAVRSTAIPACFVAALLALAGTIMQGVYPDAASVGAVVRHLKQPRTEPIRPPQ
jgi:hypothetical protein